MIHGVINVCMYVLFGSNTSSCTCMQRSYPFDLIHHLPVAVCCSVDETGVVVSIALAFCCILAVVPLCMWALCFVESYQTLGHCIDMQ